MPEILVEFDTVLTTRDGHAYRPQACGRVSETGSWEGWIEFLPVVGGSAPARSGRETEQPNRADLLYWAEGLTQVYLEGALNRALSPSPPAGPASLPNEPAFDAPRQPELEATSAVVPTPSAVLDPFQVYAQGPDVLSRQLKALDASHLRGIVLAYGLASLRITDAAGREDLARIIIAAAHDSAGKT